jgi:hypothetical protein
MFMHSPCKLKTHEPEEEQTGYLDRESGNHDVCSFVYLLLRQHSLRLPSPLSPETREEKGVEG